jgi:hypothetical protein
MQISLLFLITNFFTVILIEIVVCQYIFFGMPLEYLLSISTTNTMCVPTIFYIVDIYAWLFDCYFCLFAFVVYLLEFRLLGTYREVLAFA